MDVPLDKRAAPSMAASVEQPGAPPARPGESTQVQVALGRLARWKAFGFGLWDWMFVVFIWLTVFYAGYIVAEASQTGDWGIDFMPITAGLFVIVIGWPAVRIGEEMAVIIERLDDDGGIVLADGSSIDIARNAIIAWVRRLQLLCAVGLAIAVGAIFAGLTISSEIAAANSAWIYLLGPVMIGVGAVLGVLLGSICGYGRVLSLLEANGARFAGVITRQTRETLAGLKSIFVYGFWATVVLCHWFLAWFAFWLVLRMDWGGYYELYRIHFLAFLFISVVFFWFGGYRPIMALLGRLEEMHGGPAARAGVEQQIRQAEVDLLVVKDDPVATHELQVFLEEKRADPIASGYVTQTMVRAMAAWVGGTFLAVAITISVVIWRESGSGDPGRNVQTSNRAQMPSENRSSSNSPLQRPLK
jgi:hypothetical protein